ncbi:2Fe-2S iron-sulfur cluster-binding protein [Oryzomonas sp.]
MRHAAACRHGGCGACLTMVHAIPILVSRAVDSYS